MERESKESRGLEAHCRGGQGPPRAVAPSGGGGEIEEIYIKTVVYETRYYGCILPKPWC